MSEEDFDIDAVLDEVNSDVKKTKKKQKRRLGQDLDGKEEFNFDFEVTDSGKTIQEVREKADQSDEGEIANNSELEESLESLEALETAKSMDASEKTKEKIKKSKSKSTKGKRIMELEGLDFGNISFDNFNEVEKDVKKASKPVSKNKNKRRSIVGNEFDVLEEELEKIQAIQKQMKTKKTALDKEKNEGKEEESRKKFQNIFRLLIFLVLVMSIVLAFAVINRNKAEMDTKRVSISQSDNFSNGSNYIFVDAKLKIEDGNLEIKKLRLDSQELAVYIDKPVDFDRYKFHVLDDKLNRYYETTDYNQKFVKGSETKLTFEPLEVDIEKFSIRVENIETGYFAETVFVLDEPLKYPAAKYYYNAAPEDTNLYISSSVFSSAYTKSVLVAEGQREDVQDIATQNIETGNMYIKHKNELVPINTGEIDYAYFDEYGLGISVIKNSPLDSLQGNVEFGANNINKQQTIGRNLDLLSLSMGKKINSSIGDNKVTIEGIYNYDGVVVIPMSGTKQNAIPSNPKVSYEVTKNGKYEPQITEATDDETYNHIAVKMDATLYAKDENGEEFKVPADCKVGISGTDVVFQDERLKNKSLSEMQIYVTNYSTVEDGYSRTLDLQYVQNIPRNTDDEFKNFVKESFVSRLKYKSKEITKNHITGFADEVNSNFLSSGKYVPVDTMTTAYYSVNVVGFAVVENEYFAIVDESWIAKGKDGMVMRMENRHKIVAEKQGRDYQIVYDKITSESR